MRSHPRDCNTIPKTSHSRNTRELGRVSLALASYEKADLFQMCSQMAEVRYKKKKRCSEPLLELSLQ
jgi:hypothetical protein